PIFLYVPRRRRDPAQFELGGQRARATGHDRRIDDQGVAPVAVRVAGCRHREREPSKLSEHLVEWLGVPEARRDTVAESLELGPTDRTLQLAEAVVEREEIVL